MKWIAALCGQYLNVDYIAYFDCKESDLPKYEGKFYLHAHMHDGKVFEIADLSTTEDIHKFMPKFLASRNIENEMAEYISANP